MFCLRAPCFVVIINDNHNNNNNNNKSSSNDKEVIVVCGFPACLHALPEVYRNFDGISPEIAGVGYSSKGGAVGGGCSGLG